MKSCFSNVARTCAATSSGFTGWLKRRTMIGAASKRPPGRYQLVWSRFAVGVMKLNVYGAASLRPLTAVVPASIVTSYFVASGSRFAGVRIRMVVPDHRYVPATAGRDVKERRLQPRRHPRQRHHRLREDDADLVALLARPDLSGRTGADDPQRRALRRRLSVSG